MSIFEEIFPGVGRFGTNTTEQAICGLADEVRALRLSYEKRNEMIDKQDAALDEEERMREKSKAEQIERLGEIQRQALSMITMPGQTPFPVPSLGFAEYRTESPSTMCVCGDVQAAHDSSGCFACECKEFRKLEGKL